MRKYKIFKLVRNKKVEISYDEYKLISNKCKFKRVNGDKIQMSEKEFKSFNENNKNNVDKFKRLVKILTNDRENYLRETFMHWFDDVENMPIEIKDKRNLAKSELVQIKNCTNLNDLSIFNKKF